MLLYASSQDLVKEKAILLYYHSVLLNGNKLTHIYILYAIFTLIYAIYLFYILYAIIKTPNLLIEKISKNPEDLNNNYNLNWILIIIFILFLSIFVFMTLRIFLSSTNAYISKNKDEMMAIINYGSDKSLTVILLLYMFIVSSVLFWVTILILSVSNDNTHIILTILFTLSIVTFLIFIIWNIVEFIEFLVSRGDHNKNKDFYYKNLSYKIDENYNIFQFYNNADIQLNS